MFVWVQQKIFKQWIGPWLPYFLTCFKIVACLLPEIIFILYQNFTFSNASIVLEKRDSIHEMFFFLSLIFFTIDKIKQLYHIYLPANSTTYNHENQNDDQSDESY